MYLLSTEHSRRGNRGCTVVIWQDIILLYGEENDDPEILSNLQSTMAWTSPENDNVLPSSRQLLYSGDTAPDPSPAHIHLWMLYMWHLISKHAQLSTTFYLRNILGMSKYSYHLLLFLRFYSKHVTRCLSRGTVISTILVNVVWFLHYTRVKL